ncbi:MAG: ABC transporter substrate-binding protein [Dehalococcoidia bacterium]
MRASRFLSSLSFLMVLALACAPAAPAPTGSTGPGSQPQSQPFTLRVGAASLQATLDAQAIIGQNPRRYGIYEGLLGQDETGKLIPALASEWKNLNPTTWQFKLAPNRKFSDGNPVTAEDIAWSWNRAINPENKLGITGRLGTLDKAVVVDAQTVNLITKTPDALLPKRAAAVVIMRKAWVESVPPGDLTVKAVGAGPYMVREFIAGDRLVLVPNPNYPVKPFATELIVRSVPEASARLAGLRTGELDLIGGIPLSNAEQLKTAGFQIYNFNQGSTSGAIMFTNLLDQPTRHKEVRQAFNYAIDKDSIVKNIYLNYTKPTGQLVQSTTTGYNPNIKPYPYDPAKAKQLLAQAGYPNGFKIKIDATISNPELQAMFLFIQDAFRSIGVDSELITSADPQFNTDRFYGRVARNPVFSQGLVNSPAMDADFAISWFRSTRPESERWYINPAFDTVYDASTQELDEKKREVLLQQALQILHDDAPFLYLIDGFSLWAAAPSLGNIIVRGDNEPLFNIITKK